MDETETQDISLWNINVLGKKRGALGWKGEREGEGEKEDQENK